MGKIARLGLLPLIFAAACADDEFQPPPSPIDAAIVDSPQGIDALELDAAIDAAAVDAGIDAMSSVSVVQCPGNPDLTIGINGGGDAFMPNTGTIPVNGVVEFDPNGTSHNMVSGTLPNGDGQFGTPTGQVTCLRFTVAGTYPFFCSLHSFTGTLTVQ
jgi:plastocyanin